MAPLRRRLFPALFLLAPLGVNGCDTQAEPDGPAGPGAGGKADDTALRVAFDYPYPAARMRSETFEGATHSSVSGGEAQVFAQRVTAAVPEGTEAVYLRAESLRLGRHDLFVDAVTMTLEARSGSGPWTPIASDEGRVGFPSVTIDNREQVLYWNDDEEGLDGAFELDGPITEIAVSVAPVAALQDDPEPADAVYRLHVGCDDGLCVAEPEPLHDFPERIPLASPNHFPKSGLAHLAAPETGAPAIYLTSLGDGTVSRLDAAATGETRETVILEGEPDTSTIGVDLDAGTDTLWVCAVDNTRDELPGALWSIDLRTGERTGVYDLSEAAPDANCNEIVVSDEGIVFASDRQQGRIYRLDPGAQKATLFADSDILQRGIGPTTVGLNGIQLSPDQSRLFVVHYNPSILYTVPLDAEDPNEALREVELDGTSGSFNRTTIIPDGPASLGWLDGALIAVYPDALIRVVPRDAQWEQAWFERVDLDESRYGIEDDWMTGQIQLGESLYLTNGQTGAYLLGRDPVPFFLQRVEWTILDRE